MKKIITLCFAIMAISSMNSQVVTNGLIGYWGLDGNANDTAPLPDGGNNWHGTVSLATLTSDRFGDPDTAYEFGTNSKIQIPSVDRITKSISISIWVFPNSLGSNSEWLINQRGNPANDQFQIAFNSTSTNLAVFDANAGFQILFADALIAGQWNHIVLQTEGTAGSNIEGWINNVAQTPITLTSDMFVASHEIVVGQQGWGTAGQLNGKVDEIALFNRVLTAAEVDDIYNYDPSTDPCGDGLWTDNGTNIYRIGKVAVNTETLPAGFDFAVDGKIVTKEVKVTLSGWADFVFEKDYQLPTLQEVEKHIKEKGHLPSIPSAKEVEEKGGFSLGEMNKKLLQKVEELTLYMIQQNKQLEKQKERIKALEEKLANKKG